MHPTDWAASKSKSAPSQPVLIRRTMSPKPVQVTCSRLLTGYWVAGHAHGWPRRQGHWREKRCVYIENTASTAPTQAISSPSCEEEPRGHHAQPRSRLATLPWG
jgi:hypothetical protein